MTHRHCFEALDRTLRDLMHPILLDSNDFSFGRKTIVLGGDFRQILPVIPKGRRQDIVNATLTSSKLWRSCTVLRLTENMRLRTASSTVEENEIKSFSTWLSAIGDGQLGDSVDGEAKIVIPDEFLVNYSNDPISSIVEEIYPSFIENMCDCNSLKERAILCPTIKVVDMINDYMLSMNINEGRIYLSADKASISDSGASLLADIHTVEFLNTLNCSGFPVHSLELKIGTPVMLIRNLDPLNGLCNGTRLLITHLGSNVIQGEILTGENVGAKVLIPRMSITMSDALFPFKFDRRQFPIILCYAMTINKSQGQSLSKVGLFLNKPIFTHSQLYVAAFRVTTRGGLKILICDDDDDNVESDRKTTVNVVYKEVLQNV